MGYKIPTQTIEGIVKQLEANNKVLESLKDNFEKCIEEEKLRKGNL